MNAPNRQLRDVAALARGSRVAPNANDMIVYTELERRGIDADDVHTFGPHQNVRTYRAWRALGRQVRRGEKSITLPVWIPDGDEREVVGRDGVRRVRQPMRRRTACVFHVSQTDAIDQGGAS